MDAVRDLGRTDPWQESLERSRARRKDASARRPATDRPHAPSHTSVRWRIAVRRATAILAVTLPVALLVNALAGRRTHELPTSAQLPAMSASALLRYAESGGAGPLSRALLYLIPDQRVRT